MTTNQLLPIQELEVQLRARFPDAKIERGVPMNPQGIWFLDVTLDGHWVIIQWQGIHGFGVSCSEVHYYGDGCDEVYQDLEATYARVVCLLLSKTYTSPPPAVLMRELRKERQVSQVELAEKLEIRQAAVSKFENRGDMLVSSVRDVVRSLGGELQLIAKFPDGMQRAIKFVEEEAGTSAVAKRS